MIASPDEHQAIVNDELKPNNTDFELNIHWKEIQTVSSVNVLFLMIDDEPNFNFHIDVDNIIHRNLLYCI